MANIQAPNEKYAFYFCIFLNDLSNGPHHVNNLWFVFGGMSTRIAVIVFVDILHVFVLFCLFVLLRGKMQLEFVVWLLWKLTIQQKTQFWCSASNYIGNYSCTIWAMANVSFAFHRDLNFDCLRILSQFYDLFRCHQCNCIVSWIVRKVKRTASDTHFPCMHNQFKLHLMATGCFN